MKILTYEEYQDKLKKLRTSKDVSNFAKELVAPVLQEMLEAEMLRQIESMSEEEALRRLAEND